MKIESITEINTPVKAVRLDKWLWAARFFKTRALAKKAIEGGKVRMAHGRLKVSKLLNGGEVLSIQQGLITKEIEVLVLSEQRGNFLQAQQLYHETPASLQRREQTLKRLAEVNTKPPLHKPNKKARRQLHRFQQKLSLDDH